MNPQLFRNIPLSLRYIADTGEQGAGSQEQVAEAEAQEAPPEESAAEEEAKPDADAVSEDQAKDVTYLNKELERTRREAANYRTQLREAQDALASAKSPEEFEAIKSKLEESETARVRDKVKATYELPDAIAELLQGKTEDELVAHAKKLAPLVAAQAAQDGEIPGGGLHPNGDSDEDFDAVAQAKKQRARRR